MILRKCFEILDFEYWSWIFYSQFKFLILILTFSLLILKLILDIEIWNVILDFEYWFWNIALSILILILDFETALYCLYTNQEWHVARPWTLLYKWFWFWILILIRWVLKNLDFDIELGQFFKNFYLDFDVDTVMEFSRILILILNIPIPFQ